MMGVIRELEPHFRALTIGSVVADGLAAILAFLSSTLPVAITILFLIAASITGKIALMGLMLTERSLEESGLLWPGDTKGLDHGPSDQVPPDGK